MADENIITPEETNAIDATSNDAPDVLDRLCEYDEESQSGCRRTQTIFALEETYNTYVSPEMRWGYWDLFCEHEDKLYFDREWLQWNLTEEATERANDTAEFLEELAEVDTFAGRTSNQISMDDVYDLVHSDTAGLPVFIDETDRFFRFENVGTDLVTVDNITRERLDIIRDSFTSDLNPFLMDAEGNIYIKDGQAYCTNLLSFTENPNAKLGLMLEDTENNKTNFYPFAELTAEQEAFVTTLARLDTEREVEIINL